MKVEVAVLGSPSLIILMVSADVKQTKTLFSFSLIPLSNYEFSDNLSIRCAIGADTSLRVNVV